MGNEKKRNIFVFFVSVKDLLVTKKRNIYRFFIATIVFLIIIYANNYHIMLRLEGLVGGGRRLEIYASETVGNDVFQIAISRDANNDVKLARISRNSFGIWSADLIIGEEHRSPECGAILIIWVSSERLKYYYPTEGIRSVLESNVLFQGNNAVRLIEFLPGDLPDNVTAGIRQSGSDYLIHFISFAGFEAFNNFDIGGFLLINGFISQSYY